MPIGIGDVSDAGGSRRRTGRTLQGAVRRPAHRRQAPGSSRLLMLPFRQPAPARGQLLLPGSAAWPGTLRRTRLVIVAAASGSSGNGERPPYEQARDELTELVKRLEAGGLTLEQSLQLWERGEELATICEEWLEG